MNPQTQTQAHKLHRRASLIHSVSNLDLRYQWQGERKFFIVDWAPFSGSYGEEFGVQSWNIKWNSGIEGAVRALGDYLIKYQRHKLETSTRKLWHNRQVYPASKNHWGETAIFESRIVFNSSQNDCILRCYLKRFSECSTIYLRVIRQ